MISGIVRTAFAALFVVAASAAHAQTGPVTQDTGDYKPPARQIAKQQTQAAARATSPATAQGAQKTIGLISIIGDSFMVKTVGITVFGNEENKYPIAGWKVNDRVAATVTNLLKKNFKVKRIPASEADFASVYATGGLFRDVTAEFDAAVRKVAANQPADYYLAISRMVSPFGSSNQYVAGLGVTRASSAFGGSDFYHALTMLSVYDAQLKPIRVERGTIGQETFLAAVKGPHLIVDEDAKRLPQDPRAALNHPRAKEAVLDLLEKSLTMTVPQLFATD